MNVEEGDKSSKPYFWRGSNVYIRANASDRRANNLELEEIYKAKYAQNGSIAWP